MTLEQTDHLLDATSPAHLAQNRRELTGEDRARELHDPILCEDIDGVWMRTDPPQPGTHPLLDHAIVGSAPGKRPLQPGPQALAPVPHVHCCAGHCRLQIVRTADDLVARPTPSSPAPARVP